MIRSDEAKIRKYGRNFPLFTLIEGGETYELNSFTMCWEYKDTKKIHSFASENEIQIMKDMKNEYIHFDMETFINPSKRKKSLHVEQEHKDDIDDYVPF